MNLNNLYYALQQAMLRTTGKAFKVPDANNTNKEAWLVGWGTTVPSAVEGWVPGAIFIDYDASSGA